MTNPIAIILAERNGFGRVTQCECGAIHLEIGSVRLSFAADLYAQFADLIGSSISRSPDPLAQAGTNGTTLPMHPENSEGFH